MIFEEYVYMFYMYFLIYKIVNCTLYQVTIQDSQRVVMSWQLMLAPVALVIRGCHQLLTRTTTGNQPLVVMK